MTTTSSCGPAGAPAAVRWLCSNRSARWRLLTRGLVDGQVDGRRAHGLDDVDLLRLVVGVQRRLDHAHDLLADELVAIDQGVAQGLDHVAMLVEHAAHGLLG